MTAAYIEIPVTAETRLPAYVVEADGYDRRAGLVVLQEIFGVNANMRQTAASFAALGYDVIVPDLFWRQESRVELDPSAAADRERASALMKGLDQERAVDDALLAAAYLRDSQYSSGKTGMVGYCLGGKLAYLAATRAGVNAAVSYYGVAIQDALDRADNLAAPLLIHIAMQDQLCPVDAQAALHEALGSRPNVSIIDYPGVGHAFARRGSAAFDREAAERADAATAAFFLLHLREPP